MIRCYARQYGDQMQCGKCGLTWDINDPEPPSCKPIRIVIDRSAETTARRYLRKIREMLQQ